MRIDLNMIASRRSWIGNSGIFLIFAYCCYYYCESPALVLSLVYLVLSKERLQARWSMSLAAQDLYLQPIHLPQESLILKVMAVRFNYSYGLAMDTWNLVRIRQPYRFSSITHNFFSIVR